MPTNSNLAVPISLSVAPENKQQAVQALNLLFQACGHIHCAGSDQTFSVRVFDSPDAARSALMPTDAPEGGKDRFAVGTLVDVIDEASCAWVAVTSFEDATLPAVLMRWTFQNEEFVEQLLDRIGTQTPLVEAYRSTLHEPGGAITDLLRDLALQEIKEDIASSLSGLPYSEKLDLADHARYLKDPFGVDPVATMLSDPDALHNVVAEKNLGYADATSDQISKESVKQWGAVSDGILPTLALLDLDEDDAESAITEWSDSIVQHRGAVEFDLDGNVAVGAFPKLNGRSIDISFDGISSSSMNANIDADYLAMLDTLQMNPGAWASHLAVRAGLAEPRFNLDLKKILDDHQKDARFDPATGYHFESRAARAPLREAMIEAIFHLPNAALTNALQVEQTARTAYRAAVRSEQPDAVLDSLDEQLSDAVAARKDLEPEVELAASAAYLLPLAIEVLKAEAARLDADWLTEHGVDLAKMEAFTSSRVQLETYPQLVNWPQYEAALVSIAPDELDYEWKNDPDYAVKDAPKSLIAFDRLTEVLDNCSYDCDLVIAFECSLDDLQKMAVSAQDSENPKTINVHNAYMHLHNYMNGAGDGVPLQGTWEFSSEDLRDGTVSLSNDSTDSYGIQGVFGEFLARDSSITLSAPRPSEPAVAQDRTEESLTP